MRRRLLVLMATGAGLRLHSDEVRLVDVEPATSRTIGPRHPYYTDTKINVEEIAAMQILCK